MNGLRSAGMPKRYFERRGQQAAVGDDRRDVVLAAENVFQRLAAALHELPSRLAAGNLKVGIVRLPAGRLCRILLGHLRRQQQSERCRRSVP